MHPIRLLPLAAVLTVVLATTVNAADKPLKTFITAGHEQHGLHHFSASQTPDIRSASANGFSTKSVSISSLQVDVGAIDLEPDGSAKKVGLAIYADSPLALYGASKLEAALRRQNIKSVIVNNSASTGKERIKLEIVTPNVASEIKPEGF